MGLVLTIIISVLLVGVAFAKILQAKELVDDLKDQESEFITRAEIKTNALGLLVFVIVMFVLLIAQIVAWNKYMLPSSASVHGEEIDTLMNVTNILILFVFFITQALLFWFGYKYYFRKGRKAYWYPHNNSLELAWTIVPATVLAAGGTESNAKIFAFGSNTGSLENITLNQWRDYYRNLTNDNSKTAVRRPGIEPGTSAV